MSQPASAGVGDARARLIEDLGQLYARYGVSLAFGRVFALLLASDEPLSLDRIADQLRMSKSAASIAARDLERAGVARRLGTPGSRRVLYEARDEMDLAFEAQFARIRESLAWTQRAEAELGRGKAGGRMRTLRELHEFWLAESDGIIDRWRRREAQR